MYITLRFGIYYNLEVIMLEPCLTHKNAIIFVSFEKYSYLCANIYIIIMNNGTGQLVKVLFMMSLTIVEVLKAQEDLLTAQEGEALAPPSCLF